MIDLNHITQHQCRALKEDLIVKAFRVSLVAVSLAGLVAVAVALAMLAPREPTVYRKSWCIDPAMRAAIGLTDDDPIIGRLREVRERVARVGEAAAAGDQGRALEEVERADALLLLLITDEQLAATPLRSPGR